ncbi:hypothetical protein [Pseudomonas aeruginosa]|uniref:hypothetical protein n=1 Tax=Pseudomonas aeruginosa TaxID=287 RepID=UPI000EAF792C|nr:hypothetical protein [Pseudomonas aeruginosa]HBO1777891.1 hypothetical protein [Pseudomonas aeruginosa]HBP1789744.1 hypothetical protein [Pseudomonas aeruginosa]HEJ2002169.1 hypothetical protein [Pseudomonas aeruginosa]
MSAEKPRERPILFNDQMVRAILEGRKTVTRRVMKPQPTPCKDGGHHWPCKVHQSMLHVERELQNGAGCWCGLAEAACPYGQPGDRLWVRETWGVISNTWDESGNMVDWTPDRPATPIRELPFGSGYYSGHAIYAADGPMEWAGDDDGGGEPRSAWKPSIHMPRAISRILLEITAVRVERLQDITEDQAIAEGIDTHPMGFYGNGCITAGGAFLELWESINGDGRWAANPWVWVVEFRRVTP